MHMRVRAHTVRHSVRHTRMDTHACSKTQEHPQRINERDPSTGMTALCIASAKGFAPLVRELIRRGAKLDSVDMVRARGGGHERADGAALKRGGAACCMCCRARTRAPARGHITQVHA